MTTEAFRLRSTKEGPYAFPFYIVCDVSRSMWDLQLTKSTEPSPFQVMQTSLMGLIDELERDVTAQHTAHVAIIEFGDAPKSVLTLTPMREQPSFGVLSRQTETNYKLVFEFLAQQVARDFGRLQAHPFNLYTPAIFFITDGDPQSGGVTQPLQSWLPARRLLDGKAWSPTIVALGFGNVQEKSLLNVFSRQPPGAACIADRGGVASDLLGAIVDSIVYSISNSSAQGSLVFEIPDGMRRIG